VLHRSVLVSSLAWSPIAPKRYNLLCLYSRVRLPQRQQSRKRRPTPASLVILNEHNSPEIDEKRVTNTQESQNASPKQRKQSVYTPPAMKGASNQEEKKRWE
ncbi:protein phosphatase 1, regulatory (inhibitor) subunit 1C, isoform CRA_a, partial [Mus musculus]